MGQSTIDLSNEERILKYVKLADRSGARFAFKHEKYEPECQAEARFILTCLILEEYELFNRAEDEEVFLKIVISRRLRNYFRGKSGTEQVGVHPKHGTMVGEFKADPSDDVSIIDEMESIFPGQSDLLALWRKGFDLREFKFLSGRGRTIIQDMLTVKTMLERSRKATQRKREKAEAA
jgi:hypothetical protein